MVYKPRVLLTAINSSPAINVIQYLKKQKKYSVVVIGCDITEYTAGRSFVDKFYKIPRYNSSLLLPELLNICNSEKIDIIIPVFEPELLILSENREMFDAKIVLPSKDVVKLCLNKKETLKLFAKNKIPTCKIHNPKQVELKDLPLFSKPIVGNSSKGIRIINTIDELKFVDEKQILCDLLQGEEFTIDVYCSGPGVVECMLARKRIEISDGMAVRATIYRNQNLFDYCEKIMRILKYEGVCCLQCILDQDFKFFEINPRFGGSTNLTLEAGYNIPLYILDNFYNKKIKLPKKTKNLYMVKYYKNAYWEQQ